MAIFDFFKRDYQSKAELRTINSNLEKRNADLTNEINKLRDVITKKNNRIINLEGEIQTLMSESNKRQSVAQEILRQKRAEIANLRKQLAAAHSIIDAREEDRKEPGEVLTELVPKRRRNYHRNSNGKFAKQEQEKAE
jgi:predicted  nucleic acid-binding Zn-ribbon protein